MVNEWDSWFEWLNRVTLQSVTDFPICLVGWILGPQRQGGLWPRCIIFFVIVIDLFYTCCHNPSVNFLALHFRITRPISRHALISVFIVSFHKSSEIDKVINKVLSDIKFVSMSSLIFFRWGIVNCGNFKYPSSSSASLIIV